MRILRYLFPLVSIIAVALASPVLMSGCSSDSGSSGVQVEANKQQQELLHQQIQKGLAKRPATKRR
jgi:hypothetical protein